MAQKVKLEDKTQFICEKAYETFVQNGMRNFSLNKFIASLNMSKGQFYYYFKTKEALIYEVIRRKSDKMLGHVAQDIKTQKTFLDKLLAFFASYMDLINIDPMYADLDKVVRDTFVLYMNVENEYIKQIKIDFYNATYAYLETIFEEMILEGYLNIDAKKWLRSIIATADGMYFHAMIKEDYDLKNALSEYLIMLDDLLRRKEK